MNQSHSFGAKERIVYYEKEQKIEDTREVKGRVGQLNWQIKMPKVEMCDEKHHFNGLQ